MSDMPLSMSAYVSVGVCVCAMSEKNTPMVLFDVWGKLSLTEDSLWPQNWQ